MSGRNGDRVRQDVDLERGEVQRQSASLDESKTTAGPDENDASSVTKSNGAITGSNGLLDHGPRAQLEPSSKRSAREATPGNRKAQTAKEPNAKAAAEMSVFNTPPVRDPDPAAERLADDESRLSDDEFHQLMGMRKPSNPQEQEEDEKHPFRLATKHGLYRGSLRSGRFSSFRMESADLEIQVPFAKSCGTSSTSIGSSTC